jgi:17beta-estradiol 17-dehydrogenase / very-long-chain 3-oxoacyl-CoA reductase
VPLAAAAAAAAARTRPHPPPNSTPAGLNLVIISRTQARLDACAAELRAEHGVQVATCAADLCKLNAQALFRVGEALRGLEVGLLVNNAGMAYDHPSYLEEVDAQQDIDLITINTVAPTLVRRSACPRLGRRPPVLARGGALD